MAQYDPLLADDVSTVIHSPNFSLRPYKIPAWDLSTFAAVKVAETAQQTPLTVPTATDAQLNSYTYRATLDASFELEEDDFQPTINQMAAAFGIANARGIGVDLATGNGTTAPQGIVTAAHASGYTTANSGKLVYNDFDAIYFGVDRAYRQSPKCAWIISDTVYQMARNAVDNSGRPLLNIKKDEETILGKRVLVSPSVPSAAGGIGIIFGDISYFMVRVSRAVVTRNLQAPGYVEYGKGLYTSRIRCDSKLADPTGGSKPPVISAILHA
jgi:HK97 family phage major capsid protein